MGKPKEPNMNLDLVRELIKESGIPIGRIEKAVGMSKSQLLRGIRPDAKSPLAYKWEFPIIQYIKKEMQQKKDMAQHAEELSFKIGIDTPIKKTNLSPEELEQKKHWFNILQQNQENSL